MMIPVETQTLYAETLERARLADLERSFGCLSGSFGTKMVGGDAFWYFRTSEGGQGRKEFYVGPDSEEVRILIAKFKGQQEEESAGKRRMARMAAMLTHGGCMAIDPASGRVLEALAAGGVFRLGGVLVGTHAHVSLGNLLGVRWKSATRTQDLDLAAFRTMEIAVPSVEPADVWGTLESRGMGFLPTPGLDPRSPHTSYHVRGRELRVDLLTTASRRGPRAPVFLPRFKAAALPMPYMDYLLEGSLEALALSNNGASLVRVPQPARYGFHKLLVASARPVVEHVKVAKDAAQAAELLEFLLQARPVDIEMAYDQLVQRRLAGRTARAALSTRRSG